MVSTRRLDGFIEVVSEAGMTIVGGHSQLEQVFILVNVGWLFVFIVCGVSKMCLRRYYYILLDVYTTHLRAQHPLDFAVANIYKARIRPTND
jgi:hypothetical protein